MKIYDCFLFNGEYDILELRLQEMGPYVDQFVIVESGETFSGYPKQLTWDSNLSCVQQWKEKISYNLIQELPKNGDAWCRENYQRNCIANYISQAKCNDWILISDADEIPNPNVIAQLKSSTEYTCVRLEQRLFYFYLNWTTKETWTRPVAVKKHVLDLCTPNELRLGQWTGEATQGITLPNAGWHFSYLMDRDHILNKIRSFSHQEYNHDEFLNTIDLTSLLESGQDLFKRSIPWYAVSDVDQLPSTVVTNLERWRSWII